MSTLADCVDVVHHGLGQHLHSVLIQVGRLPPVPDLLANHIDAVGAQAKAPGPALWDNSWHIYSSSYSNSSIICNQIIPVGLIQESNFFIPFFLCKGVK